MKSTLFLLALLATLGLATELTTDYARERSLRIETKIAFEMETTLTERDGEPVESRFGGGGSEESRTCVQIDQFLANADGKPTHVKRTFETVEGEVEVTRSDSTNTIPLEGPLSGVTLELKAGEGGAAEIEVAEGKVDDSALLEGHRLELALDALLPDEEVEEGATWDLSEEAIERALGLDLVSVLYRVTEESSGGGGESGGGRRGFGSRMGSAGFSALQHVEWSGTAKLVALDEDHEGEKCARIELELEGEGEMPVPDFGRGRDRERSFGASRAASARDENTIEAKLTGEFWFAIEGRRPRSLDLNGEVKTHTEMTFEREGESSSFTTEREGKCDLEIQVSEE